MPARVELRKAEIIDGVVGELGTRLAGTEAALVERFVRLLYRDMAPEDLLERDPHDLYGAALAHLRLGQQRLPGTLLLRVYNPRLDQDGWQSTHTVIEIVNDDMPFLVDSVTNELKRHGLGIHLIVHPVLAVRRDGAGRLVELGAASAVGNGLRESYMHLQVDRRSSAATLAQIEADLRRVLGDVRRAVTDWRAMREHVAAVIAEIPTALQGAEEAVGFLRWLAEDHFTFLGYGAYTLEERADGLQLRRDRDQGLGLLRAREDGGLATSFAALPAGLRDRAKEPLPILTVTKASTRSTVHRATYLDFIGIKRFAADGAVVGEHRFVGLLTSTAYNASPQDVPLLAPKVERIIERAGFPRAGHAGKALANILETYPRDELLQASEDELFRIATGILQLQERQRLRLFARADTFGRFVVCLVYVPRDRYNTALRERIQHLLEQGVGATESEFQALLSESTLARLMFTLRTPHGVPADLDVDDLERRLIETSRGWSERLRDSLLETCGEERGNRLIEVYGRAFPTSYQERVDARLAVSDLLSIDRLAGEAPGSLALTLYRRLEDTAEVLRFKLIRRDQPVLLSDALPILENMGLKVLSEEQSTIRPPDGQTYSLHDFGLQPVVGGAIAVERVRESFQDLFLGVWSDRLENDGFNRLVLAAGLGPRAIVILRAYCKYLLQIGTPFSQAYVEQTLVANPELARDLSLLFEQRFDPALTAARAETLAVIVARIRERLNGVASLDQDRIIRRYLELIQATLRTNAWQRDPASGAVKDYVSFKIDPALIPAMPRPRPLYKILV